MIASATPAHEPRQERGWQFSLRDILWLTAGVAAVLSIARLTTKAHSIESSTVLALVFWPAPLAIVGLFPRPGSSAEVTPGLAPVTLWRVIAIGYLFMLLELWLSTATESGNSAWAHLGAGVLATAHAGIVVLGGLIVAESYHARDRFPASHVIGIAIYLYWLVAGGIFALWFAVAHT